MRRKLEKRQAGQSPKNGLLRLLVVDFSRMDTALPGFIAWPGIADRVSGGVHIVAGLTLGLAPYDIVIPAMLGPKCCFGKSIWLTPDDAAERLHSLGTAALTVPVRSGTRSRWIG